MAVENFTRAGLIASGFVGFETFVQLHETSCATVPASPGVYVVLRKTTGTPAFLEQSVGGWFKGRNPSVPAASLAAKWLESAPVVYIGKADILRRRLQQFTEFGLGRPIGHWGGRYIWSLPDSQGLVVAWRILDPSTSPARAERLLIDAFVDSYGNLPFANLNRPRLGASS